MGAATNCAGVDDVPGQAEVDSDHLDDDQLFASMILLIPAGAETTFSEAGIPFWAFPYPRRLAGQASF
jgi:cytochrome P450